MKVMAVVLAALVAAQVPAARAVDTKSFHRSFVGSFGGRPATLQLDNTLLGVLWGRVAFSPVAPAARSEQTELLLEGSLAADGSFVLEPSSVDGDDIGPAVDDGVRPLDGKLVGRIVGNPAVGDATVRVEGTFTGSGDGSEEFAFHDVGSPAVGRFVVRSRSVGRTWARSVYVGGRLPQLLRRDGRAIPAFDRAVDALVGTRAAELVAEGADAAIEIDFDVVTATPRLVSILFTVDLTYENGISTSERLGLTYDVQRGVGLRLENELDASAHAGRLFADVVQALCRDTAWRYRYGSHPNGGGAYWWIADERGVVLLFAVEQSAGGWASVVLPWPFVRSLLRPMSPLRSSAFAPAVSGPSA